MCNRGKVISRKVNKSVLMELKETAGRKMPRLLYMRCPIREFPHTLGLPCVPTNPVSFCDAEFIDEVINSIKDRFPSLSRTGLC